MPESTESYLLINEIKEIFGHSTQAAEEVSLLRSLEYGAIHIDMHHLYNINITESMKRGIVISRSQDFLKGLPPLLHDMDNAR